MTNVAMTPSCTDELVSLLESHDVSGGPLDAAQRIRGMHGKGGQAGFGAVCCLFVSNRGIPLPRIVILIPMVGMLLPSLALSDWKYAHWGATPEQLVKVSGGAVRILPLQMRQTDSTPRNSVMAAKSSYIDGNLHLQLSFSFDSKSGGLNCIVFDAAMGSPAHQLKQMFFALNGRPDTAANYRNLGIETYSWSTKTDQIGLTLMGDGSSFATQCSPGTNPPDAS